MKISWLIVIVCLSGCHQQKDDRLTTWIKQAWASDPRHLFINGGFRGLPVILGNFMDPIPYDGDSPEKAAEILARTDSKYSMLGPVEDVRRFLVFTDRDGSAHEVDFIPSVYCVHAAEADVSGYIVIMMRVSQSKDHFNWAYRFYPEDYFIKIEQKRGKKNGA